MFIDRDIGQSVSCPTILNYAFMLQDDIGVSVTPLFIFRSVYKF